MNKLFIVEDDSNILSGLEANFRLVDFMIFTDNGNTEIEELLSRIEDIMPDYIVLDLILPKYDGFQILQKLKSNSQTHNIPIFVFSDLSEDDIRQRCDDLGADYFFIKQDFNIEEFVSKVSKIINNLKK